MQESVFRNKCCFSPLTLNMNSVHIFSIYCALVPIRFWAYKGWVRPSLWHRWGCWLGFWGRLPHRELCATEHLWAGCFTGAEERVASFDGGWKGFLTKMALRNWKNNCDWEFSRWGKWGAGNPLGITSMKRKIKQIMILFLDMFLRHPAPQ